MVPHFALGMDIFCPLGSAQFCEDSETFDSPEAFREAATAVVVPRQSRLVLGRTMTSLMLKMAQQQLHMVRQAWKKLMAHTR